MSHSPHIRLYDSQGDIQVWVVDGSYVRGHVDKEFTNFGQHYRFPFIPETEFWLDQGAEDEYPFFIEHLLVEHRLMAQGRSYDDAIAEAGRAERRERRRGGDLKAATHSGESLPLGDFCHKYLWKRLDDGLSVWIVHGRLVRSVFDEDFTAGGHDHVYEFVPRGEVWIDDGLIEVEWPYALVHELRERYDMAAGEPYRVAHPRASRLEYLCRRHPDELHGVLSQLGWA